MVRPHVARNVPSLCPSLAILTTGGNQDRIRLSISTCSYIFIGEEDAIIIGSEPAQAVHQGRPYSPHKKSMYIHPEKPRITITVATNKIMLKANIFRRAHDFQPSWNPFS